MKGSLINTLSLIILDSAGGEVWLQILREPCHQMGVEIEIMENNDLKEPDQEMVEDLIAIITSFSARIYGARGGRKVKQCLLELGKER